MSSNGKLNKGIENVMVQDFYRAITLPNGSVQFNKLKMANLCFVKFHENGKVYVFNNPVTKGLKVALRCW